MWNEILEKVLNFVMPWLLSWAQQYPVATMVIAFMGTARLVLKPVFAALPKFVDTTPWAWDNALLHKIMSSKLYPVASFLFDWFGSIKLPQKPKPEEAPKVEAAPAA